MHWVLLCARLTPSTFCALPPFILTMTFQGQKGCSDGDITLEIQHDTPLLSAGLVNSKTFQFTARGLCNFSPQQRAFPFVSSFVYCADVDFHFSFELSIIATGPLSSLALCPFTLAPCVFCVSSTDLFLIFSCALPASHAAKMFQGLPSVAPCSNCLMYTDLPLIGSMWWAALSSFCRWRDWNLNQWGHVIKSQSWPETGLWSEIWSQVKSVKWGLITTHCLLVAIRYCCVYISGCDPTL